MKKKLDYEKKKTWLRVEKNRILKLRENFLIESSENNKNCLKLQFALLTDGKFP